MRRAAALLLALALLPALPAHAPGLQPEASPSAWADAAGRGAFELASPLGALTLHATPATLLAPGLPAPDVALYDLRGDAWGALAIGTGWVQGFVTTPRGIVPLGVPGPEDEGLLLFEPPGSDHSNCFEAYPAHLPSSLLGLIPPSQTLANLGIVTEWPERAYQVVLDADLPYAQMAPDWAARQLAATHLVSVLFQGHVGVRFEVVAQHADLDGTILTATDTTTLLRQARDHWNAQAQPREGVHVFTGRTFPLSLVPGVLPPGQVLGESWCIGGVGDASRAYSIHTAAQPAWREAITMAHEVGHDFGAHHHYATCAGLNDPARPCTTMVTPANVAGFGFGLLERTVIRGYAEGHGV